MNTFKFQALHKHVLSIKRKCRCAHSAPAAWLTLTQLSDSVLYHNLSCCIYTVNAASHPGHTRMWIYTPAGDSWRSSGFIQWFPNTRFGSKLVSVFFLFPTCPVSPPVRQILDLLTCLVWSVDFNGSPMTDTALNTVYMNQSEKTTSEPFIFIVHKQHILYIQV